MNSERVRIIIGFTAISLIWGSTWMFIKVGLESISPIFGVLLRYLLATAILYFFVKFKKIEFPWDKTAVFLYLTLGILSFSIPYVLVYWGEQHISSGLASVLFGAYPFVIAIGSHYFLPSEPLNTGKITGVILGFAGIVIIFWSDLLKDGMGIWGIVALLVSAIMQGLSLVMVKRIDHPMSPISLTLGGSIFAVLVLFPFAFIFEDATKLRFDLPGLGAITYLGIIGTVMALVIYYWLMKRVEIVYLSLISFISPVIAVILGILFLGENLSANMFTGSIFVLFGILIANGQILQKQRPDTSLPDVSD
jgi:drug/metabolite transporter (DMT)-like permease